MPFDAPSRKCRIGRGLTRYFLCPTLLFLSATPLFSAQQCPDGHKRLLILYSQRTDFGFSTETSDAFVQILRDGMNGCLDDYSEYIDGSRFGESDFYPIFRDFLARKYAGLHFDLLITIQRPALTFASLYTRDLFPGTPVFFIAGKGLEVENRSPVSNFAGVLYKVDLRRTLEVASALQPSLKRIYVVSGGSTFDKNYEQGAREQFLEFQRRFQFTYLSGLPIDELERQVRDMPPDSAIYLMSLTADRLGNRFIRSEIAEKIAAASKVPVYSAYAVLMGHGILGGSLVDVGRVLLGAASGPLRLLHGERPEQLGVSEADPNILAFDWRQMERWNLHEASLPAGSIVQFRELTFWQEYKWRIAGAFLISLLEGLLIGMLLLERRRSQQTRRELEAHKDQLEHVVKERTADLIEARDQAQRANRAKTAFLANMSHELRTPLNAILGFSALLRSDRGLKDQHRRDLEIIGNSGEYLLGLIDDVLDMAKIEVSGVAVEVRPIDLHALVHEVVNMMQERARAKNLELLLNLESRAPQHIRSDPRVLRQVLTNLVGNAVKYTDEGSVVLSVDARATNNAQGTTLTFDVVDTGEGISAADQARIFEPFVQGENARAKKGTGLGLAITRRFVQALGGSIQLDSMPGRGSRFHVEAPVEIAGASEIATQHAVTQMVRLEAGQPDYRILIVEDQRENWLLLQRLLSTAGFRVRVAEDGAQAIEMFKEWRPHFIWMDLRLPNLGGLDAARQIREQEGGTEVKIAAVTASAFLAQRDEAFRAGLDDFLRKPYRYTEVFDCLARHLGVRYEQDGNRLRSAAGVACVLQSDDLGALQPVLLDELYTAVLSLDRERMAAVVRRISEKNSSLGAALSVLAGSLAYTPILNALRNCRNGIETGSSYGSHYRR